MSRTEIWRNFIIFGLFVLMLFITPFVFAKPSNKHSIEITTRKVEGAGKWPTQYLNIWAKNGNNYEQEYLLEGTVLRFPDQVIKLFHMFHDKGEKPGDHLKELVKLWKEYEGTDIDGDGKSVPRIIDGQFPVRIESSSNREVNDKTLAYVDLEFLAEHKTHRTFDRKKFEARKMSPFAGVNETLGEAGYQAYARKDPKTGVITYDGTNADGSNAQAVLHAPRPLPRDPKAGEQFNKRMEQARMEREHDLGHLPEINCGNSAAPMDRDGNGRIDDKDGDYEPSGTISKYSCFRNMDIYERARMAFQYIDKINGLRPKLKLDPRYSVCVANRESGIHNNARGGTPDWGMFQFIDSTGARALQLKKPVTPGFEQYYAKGLSRRDRETQWEAYKFKMIKSTQANADIHHGWILSNLEDLGTSMLNRINNGTASWGDWNKISRIYNGGTRGQNSYEARVYGQAITDCYFHMKKAMNRKGIVIDKRAFDSAINMSQRTRLVR